MDIRKVGLVGAGKMASDIFKVLSEHDFDLVMWTPFPEEAAAAEAELTRKLKKRAQKGGARGAEAEARLARMTISTDMSTLRDVDLVIEAVIESLEPKRKVFAELDRIVKPEAIFATNTSSLSPSSMAVVTSRPKLFAGLHYFYPVSLINFVEVIPTWQTAPEVTERLTEFVRVSGKRPMAVNKEVNGFLANRILAAYYNEGADLVGEGYWSPREVDAVGKRFATLGPCESVDYVGLDIILHGADSADDSWGRTDHIAKQSRGHEPWPAMYYQLRTDGRLGRKANAGFFRYEDGQPLDDPEYFDVARPKLRIYQRTPRYDETIAERRLLYALLLESVMTYERGIGSKEDIDLAAKELLGMELGPFAYIESVGRDEVRRIARELEAKVGSRYAPVGFLRDEGEPPTSWESDAFFTMSGESRP